MTHTYTTHSLRTILGRWWNDAAAATIEPHPSSGLSGALIWRATHHDQQFCLRRWPREHPDPGDLLAIHGLLRYVAERGVDFVPVPLGVQVADGHLWELAPWLLGEPYDRERASPERRLEAMRRLAQFHVAARSYAAEAAGPAPGLAARRTAMRELRAGGAGEMLSAIRAKPASGWQPLAGMMLGEVTRSLPGVLRRVEAIADTPLPLQWCLRDVKHDHLLFDGDRLVGLIDFGAAAVDSVAGDIARLLGNMVGDERHERSAAIDAYYAVRPLSADERRAIDAFDQGGRVVAAANWLQWLFVEQREFANMVAVRNQLDWLHSRLQALP